MGFLLGGGGLSPNKSPKHGEDQDGSHNISKKESNGLGGDRES